MGEVYRARETKEMETGWVGMAFSDDSRGVYVSAGSKLVLVDLAEDEVAVQRLDDATVLFSEMTRTTALSRAPDGGSLVFGQEQRTSEIWVAGLRTPE